MAKQLSYQLLATAKSVFSQCLSARNMDDYFRYQLDDNIEVPDGIGNKSDRFEWWLNKFPPENQEAVLHRLCTQPFPTYYGHPPAEELAKVLALLSQDVAVKPAGAIDSLNWHSVRVDWEKALSRVVPDPEGAITSARTLVESVCKHILDGLGQTYTEDGDLPKLHKLTARALNLAPEQHGEGVLRKILQGCLTSVKGLLPSGTATVTLTGKASNLTDLEFVTLN